MMRFPYARNRERVQGELTLRERSVSLSLYLPPSCSLLCPLLTCDKQFNKIQNVRKIANVMASIGRERSFWQILKMFSTFSQLLLLLLMCIEMEMEMRNG